MNEPCAECGKAAQIGFTTAGEPPLRLFYCLPCAKRIASEMDMPSMAAAVAEEERRHKASMFTLYQITPTARHPMAGKLGVEERATGWYAVLDMLGHSGADKQCATRDLAEREVEVIRRYTEQAFDRNVLLRGLRWQSATTGTMWFLSFVHTDVGKFAGACMVGPAPTFSAALSLSHQLKCNPGGEVQGFAIDEAAARVVPRDYCNRVLTRDECEALDRLTSDRLGVEAVHCACGRQITRLGSDRCEVCLHPVD